MSSPTRLGYLTIDPVNAAAAAEAFADSYGLDFEVVEPRDLPRLETVGATLVLDWDYLPEDTRNRALNSHAVRVVGVHGYNLSDSVVAFLRRRGVVCGRRLGLSVLAVVAGRAVAA